METDWHCSVVVFGLLCVTVCVQSHLQYGDVVFGLLCVTVCRVTFNMVMFQLKLSTALVTLRSLSPSFTAMECNVSWNFMARGRHTLISNVEPFPLCQPLQVLTKVQVRLRSVVWQCLVFVIERSSLNQSITLHRERQRVKRSEYKNKKVH